MFQTLNNFSFAILGYDTDSRMNLLQLLASSSLVCLVQSTADIDTCPWRSWHTQVFDPFYENNTTLLGLEAITEQRAQSSQKSMLGSWQGPLGCIGRFCVWSSDTSPGDGLSIITTNTNSRIVQNTTASVEITYKSPAFRTVNIANKGVGMVAAEPIRRGQRILAAKPAILVHRSLIDELADESQHKLLDLAINHLSPEARRQEFMAQAGELGGHKVKDIMFTNSFQINLGGHDGQHFGNFPEVSRFNHDCRPK